MTTYSLKQTSSHEPKWDTLTITNDFMFFTVMKDKEICKEVLERLLLIKIKDLAYVEVQKDMSVMHDAKSVRFDVYVEDSDRVYDIEMQISAEKDLRRRTRFYQSIIDITHMEKGKQYHTIKDSVIIFICTFDPFKQGLSRYTFQNICVEDTRIHLEDGTQKIFFNAQKYTSEVNEKTKNLLAFIQGKVNIYDSFIEKLEKKVREVQCDKQWRTEFMLYNIREQDLLLEGERRGMAKGILEGERRGILEGERRGILEGERRGILEGERRGILEGERRGILEGERKGKLVSAKNLLDILDDATIAVKLGLALQEVQALRQEKYLN